MRGWLLPIGMGLAVGLVAVLAVETASRPAPTPAQRAEALAAELRCPDCQGLSVADSPTRSAQEIRRQIDELVMAGASDDDVRAHFTARYGEWIRLAPSSAPLWLIPFAVVAAAGALLVAWLASRPRSAEVSPPLLTAEERRRLHEEAEALDA